jgi:4-diphosphocytidyl-2C-methyl-D-erythritol kinase
MVSGYKCAIGRGIGQKLFPLRVGCGIWYLLLDPGINISTAKIFQKWDERNKKNHIKVKLSDITEAIQRGDFPGICNLMGNDLLFYICINKTMDRAYNYFRSLISNVSMTGSGSCLFAIFNDKQKVLNAQKKIKKYKTYVVGGER